MVPDEFQEISVGIDGTENDFADPILAQEKSWEQRPANRRKHLAECTQYKDNPYCYLRFYFRQIAVRVP
uniref:Uncharacterized protein n=1 Tax=Romanomermis culicivorax TaxID=13658 RepID=A0A915ICS7_ROMCU